MRGRKLVIKIKRYYTDKEYKQLLSNMVILYDSREKSNDHILQGFDKLQLEYKKKSIDTGDYSFMIKACPELGFSYDTLFTDELCIERKNSVTELAGNLSSASKDDDRIFKEFNRMINIERCFLLIEEDRLDDILEKNYRSEYNSDAYFRTLLTWGERNGMRILFPKKENMAKVIFELCKNCLDSKILK